MTARWWCGNRAPGFLFCALKRRAQGIRSAWLRHICGGARGSWPSAVYAFGSDSALAVGWSPTELSPIIMAGNGSVRDQRTARPTGRPQAPRSVAEGTAPRMSPRMWGRKTRKRRAIFRTDTPISPAANPELTPEVERCAWQRRIARPVRAPGLARAGVGLWRELSCECPKPAPPTLLATGRFYMIRTRQAERDRTRRRSPVRSCG